MSTKDKIEHALIAVCYLGTWAGVTMGLWILWHLFTHEWVSLL